MLEFKDTEVVRRWLETALEAGAKRGLTKGGLAAHCGVTVQAVTGWGKTGRITKRNLTLASQYLGNSPSFVSNAISAAEPPARAWPFATLSAADYMRMPIGERGKVEDYARFVFEQWSQSGHARNKGKASA